MFKNKQQENKEEENAEEDWSWECHKKGCNFINWILGHIFDAPSQAICQQCGHMPAQVKQALIDVEEEVVLVLSAEAEAAKVGRSEYERDQDFDQLKTAHTEIDPITAEIAHCKQQLAAAEADYIRVRDKWKATLNAEQNYDKLMATLEGTRDSAITGIHNKYMRRISSRIQLKRKDSRGKPCMRQYMRPCMMQPVHKNDRFSVTPGVIYLVELYIYIYYIYYTLYRGRGEDWSNTWQFYRGFN